MHYLVPSYQSGLGYFSDGLRCIVQRCTSRFGWRGLWPLLLGVSGAWGVLAGCHSNDATAPQTIDPAHAFWTLQLNQHAVNMSVAPPYNTFQLTVIPRTATGTVLSVTSPVRYQTPDTSITVSTTGLMTAHFVTSKTSVIASLELQGYTLADTVLVQVTQAPLSSPLATFSIHPIAGDSAKRSLDTQGYVFPIYATTADGQSLSISNGSPLLVAFRASDLGVASVDSFGTLVPQRVGHMTVVATTWAYGVAKTDSVLFVVGYGLSAKVSLVLTIVMGGLALLLLHNTASKLILGVGAVVSFCSSDTAHPVNVVFDHPAAVDSGSCVGSGDTLPATGSGNITPFVPDMPVGDDTVACRARSFPVAGVYRWHTSLYPSDTGVLEIRPDSSFKQY